MEIFIGNQSFQVEEGSKAILLLKLLKSEAVAISINGKPVDFSTILQPNDRVELFTFEDRAGKELFWHSSAHVLAQAILRLYPNAKPTIGPPIDEGFYYDFYDLSISEHDFSKIEAEVQKILKEKLKPERIVYKSMQEAKEIFCGNKFKEELIEQFGAEGALTAYRQGEFVDLCRGPHLYDISKIAAFKIMKTSGAYWRGDSNKEMLTRVYAISFPDKKQLEHYLHVLEEAKKRDHRRLGIDLDLYGFYEEAPGMPFFHPRGMRLLNNLLAFWKALHKKAGYLEIKTPTMLTQNLWERSGHWEHYRENMFVTTIEEKSYAIKPMNCPGCMLFFRSHLRSYRQLPMRVAELGHVHRYEFSGALSGLFRVRAFTQDDAHIFMRQDQICDEILAVLQLTDALYAPFGLSYTIALSTRPEKSIGSDEDWSKATSGLKGALEKVGKPYTINEGDGAFYGPKIDIRVVDALGRGWQCATIQLDMSLPERFDLNFVDDDGKEKRPVMVHRALFGSIERFLGILVEHFAGKFPLWLSPYPITIVTVADRHVPKAKELQKRLLDLDFEADLDDSSESMGKKIRQAQLLKTNYMITIGDKEVEQDVVSVRTRDGKVISLSTEDFFAAIIEEKKSQSPESLV